MNYNRSRYYSYRREFAKCFFHFERKPTNDLRVVGDSDAGCARSDGTRLDVGALVGTAQARLSLCKSPHNTRRKDKTAQTIYCWLFSSVLVSYCVGGGGGSDDGDRCTHALTAQCPTTSSSHAGGGGERVLWTAIKAIQDEYPEARCVVYTGDVGVTPAQFVARVRERFGLNIDETVDFIHLGRRWLIDDKA